MSIAGAQVVEGHHLSVLTLEDVRTESNHFNGFRAWMLTLIKVSRCDRIKYTSVSPHLKNTVISLCFYVGSKVCSEGVRILEAGAVEASAGNFQCGRRSL